MTVEDAEQVFEAIASGIRGTGGSLEDMKSAIFTARYSQKEKYQQKKGKQLGERLKFTLFADSLDMTPAQLDKALEQGKVTLNDFMGLA